MTTISPTKAFVDSDREFWHGVLTGGGFTPIPRWTLDPVPGMAACEALVPGDLLPALRQRARRARRAAQLDAAGRARQGARGSLRRVRGGNRLHGRDPRRAVALPAGDRTRFVAGGPAPGPPDRVGAAGAPGLPGWRSGGRARPARAGVRDRVRRAGRRGHAGAGHRAVGEPLAAAGPPHPAAAVPDRGARRGRGGQDRRLSPHRAGADRRRPGGRARPANPAGPGRARLPARRAGRTGPGAAGRADARAVRAAGPDAPGRHRGDLRRPAVDLRRAQCPTRTGWPGRCWPGVFAARASWPW